MARSSTHTQKSALSGGGRLHGVLRENLSLTSTKTNAHSETGQMAVYCQNLTLGALSSRSALSVLVGAIFKKFGLFLNTPRIPRAHKDSHNYMNALQF